jgi:hypothetical protein
MTLNRDKWVAANSPIGPHGRTIYLTGIDANGKVAEGSRAQAVQGPELPR